MNTPKKNHAALLFDMFVVRPQLCMVQYLVTYGYYGELVLYYGGGDFAVLSAPVSIWHVTY